MVECRFRHIRQIWVRAEAVLGNFLCDKILHHGCAVAVHFHELGPGQPRPPLRAPAEVLPAARVAHCHPAGADQATLTSISLAPPHGTLSAWQVLYYRGGVVKFVDLLYIQPLMVATFFQGMCGPHGTIPLSRLYMHLEYMYPTENVAATARNPYGAFKFTVCGFRQ